MLIDLISQTNYNSYNISLAKIIGLHPAIYVNTLLSINSIAINKQKLTNDEYFCIDRNYVQSVTTFDINEQIEIESLLINLGILRKQENEESNALFLDVSMLTSIMMSENETLVSDIQKVTTATTKTKKKTKAEAIKDEMKSFVIATNQELREAYFDWIDSVFAKQGWMSKKSVVSAQQVIDEFSHRNLDVALKVIEIASISGYRDMTWAVNTYKSNYNVQYRVPQNRTAENNVGISNEVF